VAARPDVKERHRRQRLATHRRILDVARGLLEDRPWREVSIALVTERADLTRTAFYKHFEDRRALLLALFSELGEQLSATPGPWEADPGEVDPRPLVAQSVAALVETFRVHGRLLDAVAQEAALDAEIAALYASLGKRLSASAAARIERDVAAGRSTVADPLEVATALVWMNERYLRLRFGQRPLGDPKHATEVLSDIWIRTLYGS
jgi:AcrR family transcriptional regulator